MSKKKKADKKSKEEPKKDSKETLPPEETLTPEETAETEIPEPVPLEEQLEAKDLAIAELNSEMLRLRADTENIRRRLNKEKQECIQFSNEKLIREVIPIFDNLERALAAPDANLESLKQGVEMISKQFLALLEKENVKPIPAKGEKFDPNIHEVLSQIESDEHEENTVIEEYSRGYFLNDGNRESAATCARASASVRIDPSTGTSSSHSNSSGVRGAFYENV